MDLVKQHLYPSLCTEEFVLKDLTLFARINGRCGNLLEALRPSQSPAVSGGGGPRSPPPAGDCGHSWENVGVWQGATTKPLVLIRDRTPIFSFVDWSVAWLRCLGSMLRVKMVSLKVFWLLRAESWGNIHQLLFDSCVGSVGPSLDFPGNGWRTRSLWALGIIRGQARAPPFSFSWRSVCSWEK